MGGFLGGFVTGLANSGSRQIQEAEDLKNKEKLMQQKMMYEVAAEDYKANAAKRRKISDANEAITNMYPDAPIELRTKAAAAWIAGADPKQIMKTMDKQINQFRQTSTQAPAPPSGALPGMGAPQQSPVFGENPTGGSPVIQEQPTQSIAPTKPEVPKPWEGTSSGGGFWSGEIDPSKNNIYAKQLNDLGDKLEKAGASQELVNNARQAAANVLTIPDLDDASNVTAQSTAWLSKAADREGVNYLNADRREAFVDTTKSVLSRALQEYQPNLATEAQALLAEANSPNANFAVLDRRLQDLTGKIRRFVSPTESVALDKNAREQREAQVAPLKNQAEELRKAGKMDEALALEQQAADYVTGRAAEPDRVAVQEGAKNTYPQENTDRALKIVQKILDPSLAEGGINLNDPMAPKRKTKPDVTRAAAAILEQARSRIRRGISNKDEITEASDLAAMWKDAFPTLGDDGTTQTNPAERATADLATNATEGKERDYSEWLKLLQNSDFRKDAPLPAREIEQQIIKNSRNKDKALADIAAAKKKNLVDVKGGLPGTNPKPASESPAPTPNMDKVYESSTPIIQKENEEARRNAVISDKQKMDQAMAEGKPKRASVEEYYSKVEDLSDEDYRTYKQTNPFEGDEEDLKAYAKANAKVVTPKNIESLSKIDPEFKKISEDLNISASDIFELAKTKADANDIRQQTKSESIRQVAAERKVKMLMDMDEARFAQFVENISDETLKKFFIETRQRWNKK